MGVLLADVAGIESGGSRVAAAGAGSAPLSAVADPVAPDPVSTAVFHTLIARAAAVHGHSAAAAAVATARGAQLQGDAAAYAEGEAANAALLGGGGDGAAGTSAMPAAAGALAMPTVSVPSIPAPVTGALPGDGKTIATLIHGGGDGAGLRAAASWLSGHAEHLSATATGLQAAAAGLDADWASAAATAATGRVRDLGSWHREHAGHASAAATAIDDHLQAYAAAKAAIPTPEQFDDNERRLRAAVAANNHPLALGRYTGVINQLVAERAKFNADAVQGYSSYAASAGEHLTGAPMAPAPGSGVQAVDYKTAPAPADGPKLPPGYGQCVADHIDTHLGPKMIKDGFKNAFGGMLVGAGLGGAAKGVGGALVPQDDNEFGRLGGAVLGFVGGFAKGVLSAPAATAADAAKHCADAFGMDVIP